MDLELSDGGDIQDVFEGMDDFGLDSYFSATIGEIPVNNNTLSFEGKSPAPDEKKEADMDTFDFETEVNQALHDQKIDLFSSSGDEEEEEEEEEEMDLVIRGSAFGPSTSSEGEEEEGENKPISAPMFEPLAKETDDDLKNNEKILERIIEARIRAESTIAKQLVEILRIDVSEFAGSSGTSVTDAILERYVGNSTESDTPLFNSGGFFILFVSSILFYACRIGLQKIHQVCACVCVCVCIHIFS
jgi:hypothetical protein